MSRAWFVPLALALAAPALAATPRLTLEAPAPALLAQPVSNAGKGVAAALRWQARCSPLEPGVGLVTLGWEPAAAEGEQRLDVTAFPEGFATGRYSVASGLEPDRSSGLLERMEPGVNYYWRVLRRSGDGWDASDTARFEAPTCPVDSAVARSEQ
jgi:hypothetical protein